MIFSEDAIKVLTCRTSTIMLRLSAAKINSLASKLFKMGRSILRNFL